MSVGRVKVKMLNRNGNETPGILWDFGTFMQSIENDMESHLTAEQRRSMIQVLCVMVNLLRISFYLIEFHCIVSTMFWSYGFEGKKLFTTFLEND